MNQNHQRRILVTGATGYVGGRLLKVLLRRGYPVRALVRHPQFLRADPMQPIEVAKGDVLDRTSLVSALREVDTAYYLVHSMQSERDFVSLDKEGATNFGEVAHECGVRRIIYLGGLGSGNALSSHLKSRHEVGDVLRNSGVQIIELRASIVIGSGSLSFEMIRALVERLPVMITPRWVQTRAQPIAINDLLNYLVEAQTFSVAEHCTVEIGGADQVSYGDLMHEYARQRGLRRLMIPVPVLTPRLSSLWLGLVTPLYARAGRKLIESLPYSTTVEDRSARQLFSVQPIGVSEAIAAALRNEDQEHAETRWSDAVSSGNEVEKAKVIRVGNRLIDSRTALVGAPASVAFRAVQRIGGVTGWYYANWLWRLRGFLDLMVGGVGMRRGRRDIEDLHVGDVVDWWRVETLERGHRLRLVAEMKLPGRAWLEFIVESQGASSLVRQTAIFDPIGLPGIMYWYGIYPLHSLVFKGMLEGIVCEVQRLNTDSDTGSVGIRS